MVDRAEFGHAGQQRDDGGRTDAGNGAQQPRLGGPGRIGGDLGGEVTVEFGQQAGGFGEQRIDEGMDLDRSGFALIQLRTAQLLKLGAAGEQRLEQQGFRGERRADRRFGDSGEPGDQCQRRCGRFWRSGRSIGQRRESGGD